MVKRSFTFALSALLLTACGGDDVIAEAAQVAGEVTQSPSGSRPAHSANDPRVLRAGERLDPYLSQRKDVHLQLVTDNDNGRVVLYRVPDASYDRRVRELAGDVPVDLRDAQRPKAQLETIYFTARELVRTKTGIQLDGANYGETGDRVVVYVWTDDAVAAVNRVVAGKFDGLVRAEKRAPITPAVPPAS